jgi:hypothetical protein
MPSRMLIDHRAFRLEPKRIAPCAVMWNGRKARERVFFRT